MVTINIKKGLSLFALVVLIAIVSVVNVSVYARADNKAEPLDLVKFAQDNGIKSGDNLVRDAQISPNNASGDRFHYENKNIVSLSPNVLILTENAGSINSETEFENYLADVSLRGHIGTLVSPTATSGGKDEIIAVWSISNTDWEDVLNFDYHPSVLDQVVPPQANKSKKPAHKDSVIPVISDAGYENKDLVGDPDGSCDGSFLCFRHQDSGNTGFHGKGCYIGRWSNVWTAINQTINITSDAYTMAGGYYKFQPATVTDVNPDAVINQVNVGI